MMRKDSLKLTIEAVPGKVAVAESVSGNACDEVLKSWADGMDCEVYSVVCNIEEEGIWSGLKSFLSIVIDDLGKTEPALVQRHLAELSVVLPVLRRQGTQVLQSLTDIAAPTERVRNYAVDRIYRVLHGIVDLVAAWRDKKSLEPWILICNDLDKAGVLVQRFYSELVRRRGFSSRLFLLASTSRGQGEAIAGIFGAPLEESLIRLDLPVKTHRTLSQEELELEAGELEERVGEDPLQIELHVARLIFLWRHSGHPERALRWQAAALGLYNHLGCYEDGAAFVKPVLDDLDALCQEQHVNSFWHMTRWNVLGNIYGCLNSVGQPQLAYEVVKRNLEFLVDPRERARALYVLAMSCARFLPEKDYAEAESLLQQGLAVLDAADSSADRDSSFLRSFLANGLAFVRHRQGHPEQAIDLCRQAYDNLEKNLAPGEHKLHRSVLFYNIAQVYASTGQLSDAAEYYSAAMEMDPNYSEYFNERGSVYLGMGKLAEAEADLRRAAELSPPYSEVRTNLGQCYSLMGKFESAVEAYSTAIDLNPRSPLPWIGRAQAYQKLGCSAEAFQDYMVALRFEPGNPMLLSNRAAVLMDLGRPVEALQDLDRAVALVPDDPVLAENRLFIVRRLAEFEQARMASQAAALPAIRK